MNGFGDDYSVISEEHSLVPYVEILKLRGLREILGAEQALRNLQLLLADGKLNRFEQQLFSRLGLSD